MYKHFKGRYYEVIAVAPLVDSSERFVVYRPLYGDRAVVLRSLGEFCSIVKRNGKTQPRFRYVGPNEPAPAEASADNAGSRIIKAIIQLVSGKRRARV